MYFKLNDYVFQTHMIYICIIIAENGENTVTLSQLSMTDLALWNDPGSIPCGYAALKINLIWHGKHISHILKQIYLINKERNMKLDEQSAPKKAQLSAIDSLTNMLL